MAIAVDASHALGGHIEIVGAGPGDPELISLRGRHMLEKADLILYAGSLVPRELTLCAKPGATVRSSASMNLEEQIALLQKHMAKIDYKIRLYAKAVELGSLEKARIDKGLQKEQQKIYGADSFSTSEDAKQTTR